jgi:hypothetical protein
MKIAILFKGQPRFLYNNIALNSHKKTILDKYDTDIFMHVWWEKNAILETSSWSRLPQLTCGSNEIEYLLSNYNPNKIKVEPPRKFNLEKKIIDNLYDLFKNKQQIDNL